MTPFSMITKGTNMKRYNYGLNFQTANAALFGHLIPVSFTEVVPGDTVQGRVTMVVQSDTTKGLVLNRSYMDAYSFYVPYRLIDSGFVDLIRTNSGSTPRVEDKCYPCFETAFTSVLVSTAFTKLVPYNRRAYNLIYNKFFRRADQTEVAEDSNTFQSVSFRPTTFHESEPEVTQQTTTIDTSGATLDIDQVRTAFAKDAFNKAREYYGDRYVDFLNAVGIDTPWTILDEPESLRKTGGILQYKKVATTADDSASSIYVGDLSGYWEGQQELNIPRTFCPEHGLIVVVAVAKIENFSKEAAHPVSGLLNADYFWSPEKNAEKVWDNYWNSMWIGEAAAGSDKTPLPRFEHLRKGANLSGLGLQDAGSRSLDAFTYQNTFSSVDDYKDAQNLPGATIFRQNMGEISGSSGGVPAQIAVVGHHRLNKKSPVATRTQTPLR